MKIKQFRFKCKLIFSRDRWHRTPQDDAHDFGHHAIANLLEKAIVLTDSGIQEGDENSKNSSYSSLKEKGHLPENVSISSESEDSSDDEASDSSSKSKKILFTLGDCATSPTTPKSPIMPKISIAPKTSVIREK